MKDEEFQKNLETILKRFEKIDAEIKEFLKREDIKTEGNYLNKEPLSDHTEIAHTKYKTNNTMPPEKYQQSKKKTFI
jgi:hypothetical protein